MEYSQVFPDKTLKCSRSTKMAVPSRLCPAYRLDCYQIRHPDKKR